MRERLTARVLLFDPEGRILLMKGRLPSDPGAPGAWFTVGGGIEPGETVCEAAIREVSEETGFHNIKIGNVVWTAEQIHHDRKGRPIQVRETFVTACCDGGEPSRDAWQALEREFVDDIRWWTLEDLAACVEPVVPPDLARRAKAALTGAESRS